MTVFTGLDNYNVHTNELQMICMINLITSRLPKMRDLVQDGSYKQITQRA